MASTKRRIIDAHHHFWNVERNYHPWLRDDPPIPFRYGDYSAIRRNYLEADYRRDAQAYEVAGSVYVETEWDPTDHEGEMRYVCELRNGPPGVGRLPTVAVAHVRLDDPLARPKLEHQCRFDFVRSIRHKPRANPQAGGPPGGMTDATWRAGYALLAELGLRFDLQTPWWHLPEAIDLARAHPATPIIINHSGLPSDRSRAGIDAWKAALQSISRCPNVSIKISGIGVPGQAWTAEANREIVLWLIESFGVPRCMFASNFPVDSLCASFDAIFGGFEAIVADFSPAEQHALFCANANRIYDMRLPV